MSTPLQRNPLLSPPILRSLPSGFPAAAESTPTTPQDVALVRPKVASGLNPLPPQTPASTVPPLFDAKRIAPANPNRVALVLRTSGGNAATRIGLFSSISQISSVGPAATMQLLNDETLTLDYTGELWAACWAGTAATINAMELTSNQAQ